MKKRIKCLFVLFLCFLFFENVKAADKLSCVYSGKVEDSYGIEFNQRIEMEVSFSDNDKAITKFVVEKTVVNYSDCKSKIKENIEPGNTKEEAERYYDEYCSTSTQKDDYSSKAKLGIDFSITDGCPENISFEGSSGEIIVGFKKNYAYYNLQNQNASIAGKYSCGNIIGIPKKIPELTSWAMTMIQVAVPIIFVIIGSMDLFKGIIAQKEDEIKKGQQAFIKRLIVAVLIFFIVVIVKFFVSILANGSDANFIDCIDCFLSNDCN